MEREALLAKLMDLLREDERPVLRRKIDEALTEHMQGAGGDGSAADAESEGRALRFLQDLDIFVNLRGPDFIYSRGIAESLRVGEEIFELAYVFKRAMR
ncbi:MAG: hypothetical protein P4L39_02755 [Humidesulfovibrio sp.]|nr:hypothetical protein [Humidesulfovibrio sp.]